LNANLTAWRSAPAAVEIERLTIDWIKQIVGFKAEAGGLFVSGGSMANFAALAAARRAKAPEDVLSKGAQSFPRAMRIYTSTETHHSVAKAAALLGIGRDNVRVVGIAILAASAKKHFDGLEEANSIALDPHKWLYLPVDCGCVLYRDPQMARATFAHDAEYTRVMTQEADEAFAFWDYGPELSRRF